MIKIHVQTIFHEFYRVACETMGGMLIRESYEGSVGVDIFETHMFSFSLNKDTSQIITQHRSNILHNLAYMYICMYQNIYYKTIHID